MVRSAALICGLLVGSCTPTPPARENASTPTVSAPDLAKAFRENEIAAESKFPGSVIIVGDVMGVTRDVTGVANLQLDGAGTPVGIGMGGDYPNWSGSLRPGYRVAVLCNKPRLVLGAVITGGCTPHDLPAELAPKKKHRRHRG